MAAIAWHLTVSSVREAFSMICVSFGDNVANFCAIFLAIGCCMILAEFFKRKLQVSQRSNKVGAIESKNTSEMEGAYADSRRASASGWAKPQSNWQHENRETEM